MDASWRCVNCRNSRQGRIMSWGYEKGRVYNRRADIHDRFEGQRQGGIITPKQHPLVIINTGEEGLVKVGTLATMAAIS
jgi:hypothetical protein